MQRWGIRVIAGVLGISLCVTASACRGRGDQQAARPSIKPVATTGPSPQINPSPTSPQPTVETWRRLAPAPIDTPYIRASVWTGSEVLIFGRVMDLEDGAATGRDFDVVAAYNPATDSWRSLPAGPGREGSFEGFNQTVWTGSKTLVWGITNKSFDPATNRWRRLPAPAAGDGGPSVAVWTGRQMIGWGGGCCGGYDASGAAYTPATNSWEKLPPAPLAGRHASGAWTGKELVILGGNDADGKVFSDAAAYDPATRRWRRLPPLPEPRTGATATWDGTEVLVIGGQGSLGAHPELYADGVAYNPATNRWRRVPAMEFPRQGHVAVWTGGRLLVWGGRTELAGAPARPSHGEAYDPVSDRWSPLPRSPLRGRIGATAVWTRTTLIVWGGVSVGPDPVRLFADGAAYTPGTE
jgi:N-acetylneuraminic acid mutarotase